MAPVICRRRPDGIVEIVPPTALQRFVSDFRGALVTLAVLGVLSAFAGLYAIVGAPVLFAATVAGAFALGLWLHRRRRAQTANAVLARTQRRSATV